MPDAVSGHLYHVLEEGDEPADGDGYKEGLVAEILEVAVPREGHENTLLQESSNNVRRYLFILPILFV